MIKLSDFVNSSIDFNSKNSIRGGSDSVTTFRGRVVDVIKDVHPDEAI